MSAAIISIITANWQAIAGIFAALGAVLGIYAKGRSDAKAKQKLEDVTNADIIRKAGADARDRVAADAASGKLRDTDGWRRD